MALDKYRKKRDFTKSPEPAGDKPRKSPAGRKPRFFCVQKHLASHLHYDFRLEHNGVLLSWAVPKGPAIDPTIKRLAMHVEDHPVEYGEFEGVIPSGYGAGIVMLWDRGTWTPEVDDVDAALAKGDLKMTLDGYKLKGSWVLVRTRGWGSREGKADDGRSWLLIKHKRRLGRADRHRRVRAAEREERRRLRRDPVGRRPRHLALEPARGGRRDREDVRFDHQARAGDEGRVASAGQGRARRPKARRPKAKGRTKTAKSRNARKPGAGRRLSAPRV